MKEKVVSLSGGLVLGMVCALFLGIGATQKMTQPLHFEIPSIMQMTIAQASHSTPTPTNNTTPAVNVAAPVNEDRGRITRIATLTDTTDPAFSSATVTTSLAEPKNWENASTPKIENSLQEAYLQHSNTLSNPQTYASITIAHTAGQGNFTAIATNTTGRNGFNGGQNPSFVEGKPLTHGSPATAQGNAGDNEGEQPALTEEIPASFPDPDSFENDHQRLHVNPVRPEHTFTSVIDDHHNGQGYPDSFQNRRHTPETD